MSLVMEGSLEAKLPLTFASTIRKDFNGRTAVAAGVSTFSQLPIIDAIGGGFLLW
jgi:hypothetical protein